MEKDNKRYKVNMQNFLDIALGPNVIKVNEDSVVTSDNSKVKSDSINNNKRKVHSFEYIHLKNKIRNITDLMNSLKTKKMICSDTKLRDFRNVFTGNEIENKIIWTGFKSELTYFVKQLHNKRKLVKNIGQEHWQVTVNCFIQENGELYERDNLRGQKNPIDTTNIDKALRIL